MGDALGYMMPGENLSLGERLADAALLHTLCSTWVMPGFVTPAPLLRTDYLVKGKAKCGLLTTITP
jgi:hypothetical protein